MQKLEAPGRSKWLAAELASDPSWIYSLDAGAGHDVVAAVRAAARLSRDLLDLRREDFDFGRAAPVFAAAFEQAKHGRGVALARNLPRPDLSEHEYELMTWGIGLHHGVARPQGKASQYISAVRDAGVDYRSPNGRGYNSRSELDYHTDRADLIVLTCYNKARAGGKSMVVSTDAAFEAFAGRHPDLMPYLHLPLHFKDFTEPERKRLLYRLWLSPPDSVPLPPSWKDVYGVVAPGSVRGGILGDGYDERCRSFDRRQAAALGMSFDEEAHR